MDIKLCACVCMITNLKNSQSLFEIKTIIPIIMNVKNLHYILLSFKHQQQVPSVVDNNKIVHIIVGLAMIS